MADRPLVLCLCCGALYGADGDCPNLGDGEHSLLRAGHVAAYMLGRGIERPSPEALASLSL